MGFRMTWGWEVDGQAGADFDTVEEAVTALANSIRGATERYGTVRQTEIAQRCLAPMQDCIRTEGAQALAHGERWSGECGGLYATMTPQKTDPPSTAGTATP